MKRKLITRIIIILLSFHLWLTLPLHPQDQDLPLFDQEIEKKVEELMEQGKIPGLSLVIVKGGDRVFMKGFGYGDLENKTPVTRETFFELASCSKAFTALAALQLEEQKLLNLDEPVSKHFPWFYTVYEDKKPKITVRQLLHHTSGIPWEGLDRIPARDDRSALEQTVRNLAGIELNHLPGTQFEYATVNYDIVGLIIEKVSGTSYEDYMLKNVLRPLGLHHTVVGTGPGRPGKAKGYKIGFSKPRYYESPVFRGNNPAGYIVSNGEDMARWLKLQLGLEKSGTPLDALIRKSHERDQTVPANRQDLSSYAMGWRVYLTGSDLVDHTGLNPNFTVYIGFSPKMKIGVAVLANSNSSSTVAIGNVVMTHAVNGDIPDPFIPGDEIDKASSLIAYIFGFYLLFVMIFLVSIPIDLVKGRRKYESLNLKKLAKIILNLLVFLPFLVGIYFLPTAMSNVSWDTAIVWSPLSFQVAILLLMAAMGVSYIGSVVSTLFPLQNKYFRSMPLIVILSLLAGGANAVIIFLITSSLFSDIHLFYQVYFYVLAFFVYIFGRKVLQTKLIKLTFDIVYDLRLNLIEKIFYTSFEKFEKLERGRVYATLNDDTGQIGDAANLFVRLITSFVTTIGAFAYLATIAFWATMLTLTVVIVIATLYALVSRRAEVFLERARDTRNVYMGLLNGLIDGFKELSLHYRKRTEYKDDIEKSCDEFRSTTRIALIKFVNAFLIGESLLIMILGSVGFGIPRLFPEITTFTLMSFIMVLLYLIGPLNGILNSIPAIVQLRVAWNRVREFIEDIPANIDPQEFHKLAPVHDSRRVAESIKVKGIMFQYKSDEEEEEEEKDEEEEENFSIGPISFEAQQGEIVFIIGGNGSGKTTLAKVLTGLYIPDGGKIEINGKEIHNYQLGEYFSVVFKDYHLFQKLYNVDLRIKGRESRKYLDLLRLEDKVEFVDNSFSTIELSGGQRKRLALLQCYLEDGPIFLFDEIAADQDPYFRRFFYRELLQKMKQAGKIVIAITHDDHYFDAADKVIKLDMGKVEMIEEGYAFSAGQFGAVGQ